MQDIVIKQLVPNQVDSFIELFKSIADSNFKRWTDESKKYWFEVDYTPEYLRDNIEKKHFPIFIAWKENTMIGFAMIEAIDFGVAYLGWIGVLDQYQKQGIGGDLIKSAEDWSKKNGIHKIELDIQEPELKYFYEKNGFVFEGVKKNSWQHLDNHMFGKEIK